MDPIADMLTRIRNALAVKKETVSCSYSQINMGILKILKKQGFIKDFKPGERSIEISLGSITHLKRISKPGLRVYQRKGSLPKKALGVTIISTSRGLMTAEEARKKGVGGEVICEVW